MNRFSNDLGAGGRVSGLWRRTRELAACERGQDVAEMAIVLPFLLVIVLGVVEFGTIFGRQHTLTSLGREGANIAARGEPLDAVTVLTLESGTQIELATRGGVVSSRVVIEDGVPVIVEQVPSPGYGGLSRLGGEDDPAPALSQVAGDEGASFYVVEVFLMHESRTPLRRLLGDGVPDTLYSRAVF